MSTGGKELAKTDKDKDAGTIKGMLALPAVRKQIADALPSHCTPDRFLRVANTCIRRVPKLATCDQTSFFNCLLTLSQYGLEPDGRNAHLIPFNNNKLGIVECQLIIDYKGLVELAMRSGLISSIHADVVCENDEFEYDMGEVRRHKIDLRKDRGNVYAAYARVVFKDAATKCDVMSRADIEAIRKRSRAGGSGPWVTDFNEMAKKTVFRRLSKWISISAEFRDALDHDDDVIDVTVKQEPKRISDLSDQFNLPETPTDENNESERDATEDKFGTAYPGLLRRVELVTNKSEGEQLSKEIAERLGDEGLTKAGVDDLAKRLAGEE